MTRSVRAVAVNDELRFLRTNLMCRDDVGGGEVVGQLTYAG